MKFASRLSLLLGAGTCVLWGCNLVLGLGDYSVGTAPTDGGQSADGPQPTDGAADAGRDCNAPNKPVEELREVAQSRTLTCDKDYLLIGQVFVRDGATLTIEAGTTIKGTRGALSEFDKVSVLVVQRGAKIQAVGTVDLPIVFTSNLPPDQRKAGDWGGVVLLGNAVVNQGTPKIEGIGGAGQDITYGGADDEDSSGTLSYVRIEYGGFKIADNNEINGLTFGGVGRKTKVDHVQVRHVLDDCFEFFGGTVNASHLLCQYPQDDGIDWDFGYRGKIQFAVVQQDPNLYDDTMGIEADNGGKDPDWLKLPVSEPTLFNVTLCGPGKPTPARPVLADGGFAGKEFIRYGMVLRRHTKAHINNTIVMGFESGIDVQTYPGPFDVNPAGPQTATASLDLKNIVFFDNVHDKLAPGGTGNVAFVEGTAGFPKDNDQGYDELAEIIPGIGNREIDPRIGGCFNANTPSFGPATEIKSGSVVPDPNDDFFVPVDYIGALRDVNDPWATSGKWPVWTDK
jgi:hypothetical protein